MDNLIKLNVHSLHKRMVFDATMSKEFNLQPDWWKKMYLQCLIESFQDGASVKTLYGSVDPLTKELIDASPDLVQEIIKDQHGIIEFKIFMLDGEQMKEYEDRIEGIYIKLKD